MKQYKVVFVSKTGNTKKVAVAIYNGIVSNSKDIVDLEEEEHCDTDAGRIFYWFLGKSWKQPVWIFWIFRKNYEGKKVALIWNVRF